MIEIGKKLEGVEGCGDEGEGSGQRYFSPQWGRVWGGAVPPPQKIFDIFA